VTPFFRQPEESRGSVLVWGKMVSGEKWCQFSFRQLPAGEKRTDTIFVLLSQARVAAVRAEQGRAVDGPGARADRR
jgi:hypothetical protein